MYKRTRYQVKGFTLVELLVVIGILVILMGILFPAVVEIRRRARRVSMRAQQTGIANASGAYNMDHKQYPGFFSNSELSGMKDKWTGTENLVVSLMGQVSLGNPTGQGKTITITSGGTRVMKLNTANIGNGPLTITGKTYGAYYSPQEGELDVIEGCVSDNEMPELLDPANKLPVLYLRATRGWTDKPVGAEDSARKYAYSANVIYNYVNGDLVNPKDKLYKQDKSLISSRGASSAQLENLAKLAVNPAMLKGTTANVSTSRIMGSFLMISAGIDGIYFNQVENENPQSPAIQNMSHLSNFDDVYSHGG